MLQLFNRLRRTDQAADAAMDSIARLSHGDRSAFRAGLGEGIRACLGRSSCKIDILDLGDHVARAINLNPIPHADIPPLADRRAVGIATGDIVFVMKRGIGDNHPADSDRPKPRDRAQSAGPAHLNVDRLENRPGKFGGKLMGDGPARRGRAETKPLLQAQIVDLVDHAVDVIAQRCAARFDIAVVSRQTLYVFKPLG